MARPQKFRNKWRIRWTDETGRRRSSVFATYKDADTALKLRVAEVARIASGAQPPTPKERTVGDLLDDWLTHRAPYKRSGKDDASMIRAHLRPHLGQVQLQQLSVLHVDKMTAAISHLSPKTIRNILTLLQTALNRAVELNWLHRAPKIRKPKVPVNGANFRYLKDEHEIHRLLNAAHQIDEMAYRVYLTAIYTGMRAGELAGLRWSDIDLKRRLITVERSYRGPTKSGRVRYVPILDGLLDELYTWHDQREGPLVFTSQAGTMLGQSARLFQGRLHRVLRAAGFPETVRADGKRRRYICFHDLRHTFASYWMRMGGDIFKLQKILGHATMQMTMRYAHLSPDIYDQDHGRFGRLSRHTQTSQHPGLTPGFDNGHTRPCARCGTHSQSSTTSQNGALSQSSTNSHSGVRSHTEHHHFSHQPKP